MNWRPGWSAMRCSSNDCSRGTARYKRLRYRERRADAYAFLKVWSLARAKRGTWTQLRWYQEGLLHYACRIELEKRWWNLSFLLLLKRSAYNHLSIRCNFGNESLFEFPSIFFDSECRICSTVSARNYRPLLISMKQQLKIWVSLFNFQ